MLRPTHIVVPRPPTIDYRPPTGGHRRASSPPSTASSPLRWGVAFAPSITPAADPQRAALPDALPNLHGKCYAPTRMAIRRSSMGDGRCITPAALHHHRSHVVATIVAYRRVVAFARSSAPAPTPTTCAVDRPCLVPLTNATPNPRCRATIIDRGRSAWACAVASPHIIASSMGRSICHHRSRRLPIHNVRRCPTHYPISMANATPLHNAFQCIPTRA